LRLSLLPRAVLVSQTKESNTVTLEELEMDILAMKARQDHLLVLIRASRRIEREMVELGHSDLVDYVRHARGVLIASRDKAIARITRLKKKLAKLASKSGTERLS
jgi:hypothetical protein